MIGFIEGSVDNIATAIGNAGFGLAAGEDAFVRYLNERFDLHLSPKQELALYALETVAVVMAGIAIGRLAENGQVSQSVNSGAKAFEIAFVAGKTMGLGRRVEDAKLDKSIEI